MRSSKGKKFLVIGFIVYLVVPFVLNVGQASASAPATALKKFEAYGLYNCMTSRFDRSFTQEYVADSSNNYIKNLIKSSYLGGVSLWNGVLGQTDDDYVSLPAGHNLSNANDDKISCVHLAWNLVGSSNNENPYDSFGALLDKFGYNKENATAGSSAKCVEYNFSIASGEPSQFSDSGKITYCESSVKENDTIDITNSNPRITISSGDYHIGHIDTNDASKITYCFNNFQSWFEKCSDISDDEIAESVSRNQPWSKVTSELGTSIRNLIQGYHDKYYSDMGFSTAAINTGGGYWVKYNGMENGQSDSNNLQDMYNYKLNPFDGFKKAYQNFFGSNFESLGASYGFSKSQQAALYSNYIQSYWKADTQACADTAEASKSAAGDLAIGNDDDDIGQFYHQTKLYKSDGAAQYCYVKATENQGDKVYGLADNVVGGTLNFPASSKIGFVEVAKWLLNNGPDSVDPEEMVTSLSDGGSNGKITTDENTDPCYNAGVEGMSWVLCPALNNTTKTVDGIESFLRDWLQITPKGEGGIFENQNGDSIYDGWNIFRNVANALLTIVLLIVIFSQLTGVGIDNYGIKKMLPRLIMMGILINLSYVICQVAVDLSNILGVGFSDIMKTVGNTINGGTDPNYTVSGIVTAVFTGVGAAGVIAGTAVSAASGGWIMVVIVLLLAVLVALVAALMFFVMLSARIIIVAVFVVIAPVAFACYILPSTQGLFKKWYKVFEAALVIYPICGALYGASYIVKAVVGGDSGGFVPGIIAIVAPFLPFLALPALLKGALAGLGAIGGTLAMLGNGLKKGAASGESAIKNSNRFKDFQARREEGRATRTFDKLQGKLTKNGALSARQRSRYVRAGSIVDRGRSEREKVYGRGFAEMSRGQVEAVFSSALQGKDAERANAAFNTLMEKGGIEEAFRALDGANWSTMDGKVSGQLFRSMGSSNVDIMKGFAKYRQSGGTAGFQNWANNSRTTQEIADDGRNGAKVQSLAQYLQENGEHAMDGYGKDEAKFIASHIASIQSSMGTAFKKEFGAMMGSAGLNSKDAKAQTVWDGLIASELSKATPGSIDVDDLGMVADSIGIMREGMSHAIRQGVANYLGSTSGSAPTAAQVTAVIHGALSDQIAAAQVSSIIKDKAKSGVLKDFGITP